MAVVSHTASGVMAAIHVYILVLEMFLWNTPRGRKAFRLTPDFAKQSAPLAANQGLYNGFLAAGLVWGITHPVAEFATQIELFFLGCIVVAGAYGTVTANRKILFVQALPGAVSFLLVWLGL